MDAFQEHFNVIKILYEDAGFTAAETKDLLERLFVFPQTKPKAFAKRLGQLGLQKKAKKGSEWGRIVDRHLRARGSCPERKATGVYRHGSLVRWDVLWKEVRRSRHVNTLEADHGASLPLLPAGFAIRTPSPSPEATMQPPGYNIKYPLLTDQTAGKYVMQSWQPTHPPGFFESFLDYYPVPWRQFENILSENIFHLPEAGASMSSLARVFSALGLSGDTALDTSLKSISDICGAYIVHRDIDKSSCLRFSTEDLQSRPVFADIVGQGTKILTTSHGRFDFLLRIIYQLSNNEVHLKNYEDRRRLLDYIGDLVSEDVFTAIFSWNTATIRGAWEKLLYMAWETNDKRLFSFLALTGLRQLSWLKSDNLELYWMATSMDCHDVLTAIECRNTAAGIVLDVSFWPASLQLSNLKEDQLLKCLDLLQGRSTRVHEFAARDFVESVLWPTFDKEQCIAALIKFLPFLLDSCTSMTALQSVFPLYNVDLLYRRIGSKIPSITSNLPHNLCHWFHNYIDMAYEMDLALYEVVQRRGIGLGSKPVYVHAIEACKQGTTMLEQYLETRDFDLDFIDESRNEWIDPFPQKSGMWIFIFGVMARLISDLPNTPPSLLYTLLKVEPDESLAQVGLELLVSKFASHSVLDKQGNDFYEHAVSLFRATGGKIDERVVTASIDVRGTGGLERLLSPETSSRELGDMAMAKAAFLGNYEAIQWLLDSGTSFWFVDITNNGGSIDHSERFQKTFASSLLRLVASGHGTSTRRSGLHLEMFRHCLDLSSQLRPIPQRHLYEAMLGTLETPLRSLDAIVCLRKCELLLEMGLNLAQPPPTLPNVLTSFALTMSRARDSLHHGVRPVGKHHRKIFDLLIKSGTSVRGPILNHLLRACVSSWSHETESTLLHMIQKVLDMGASLYASYENKTPFEEACHSGSFGAVQTMLDFGAQFDMSSHPGLLAELLARAGGYSGPLQVKLDVVQRLILQGADVNSMYKPSRGGALAALAVAARSGPCKLVILLLEHGAEINDIGDYFYGKTSASHEYQVVYLTALDCAVSSGHIDVVQLLLNAGGRSANPGMSGYAGAVSLAEEQGQWCISDLIRHHVDFLATVHEPTY